MMFLAVLLAVIGTITALLLRRRRAIAVLWAPLVLFWLYTGAVALPRAHIGKMYGFFGEALFALAVYAMWPVTLASLVLLIFVGRPRYNAHSLIWGAIGVAVLIAVISPLYLQSRHVHVFYATDAAGRPVAHTRFWINVEEDSPWDFVKRRRQVEHFSETNGEVWFVTHGQSQIGLDISAPGTQWVDSIWLTSSSTGGQCDQLGVGSYARVVSNITADPDGRFHVVVRFPGDPVFDKLMEMEERRADAIRALSHNPPTTQRK